MSSESLTGRSTFRGLFAADRDEWLTRAGVLGWLVCGVILGIAFRNASIGTLILIGSVWFPSIVLFARSAVAGLFGPVFWYEMVRIGRKRLTFILRTLYLLGIAFTLLMVFLSWLSDIGYFRSGFLGIRPNQLSQYGDRAFTYFAPIQYAVVILLTPAYVAGCICDEKERKTLEFLFATDLRNREIIFGKVAARVATLLIYVLAGLPFLASLMLFGGIDPELLLAAYAATISACLALASVSAYFSVMLRRPRDAIVVTYLLLGLSFVVTLILPIMMVEYGRRFAPVIWLGITWPLEEMGLWLGSINPVFVAILAVGLGAPVDEVAMRYAIVISTITVVFLGLAIYRLRSVALHQSYGGVGIRKNRKNERAVPDRPVCEDNPVYWREVYVEGSRNRGWSAKIASALLILLTFIWPLIIFGMSHFDERLVFQGFTARNGHDFRDGMNVWLRIATGVIAFGMMMGAAIRGSSVITGEKDRDTWISLISTPLTAWQMLIGKWCGTVLSVRKLAGLLAFVWLVGLATSSVMFGMLIPTTIYILVYVTAFSWMGIFFSLTARNTLIASIRTMMAGLFFSGGYWVVAGLCCFMPLGISNASGRTAESFAVIYLAFFAPFVSGWMPMNGFNRADMGPFHPNEREGELGLLAVGMSLFVWLAATFVLMMASGQIFRKMTNRDEDQLTLIPSKEPETVSY